MRNLNEFLLEYHNLDVDKIEYITILASDEYHARREFIAMCHGRHVITCIERVYRK
jgi:hypothetical protein